MGEILDHVQEDDLMVYINDFIGRSNKHLEKGNIVMVMIYGDAEPPSLLQFKHFKNVEAEDTVVTDRILPVEIRSKLGRMFVEESRRYSKKVGDPGLRIEFTPTFLDFRTHEILLVGIHTLDSLRGVLSSLESTKNV